MPSCSIVTSWIERRRSSALVASSGSKLAGTARANQAARAFQSGDRSCIFASRGQSKRAGASRRGEPAGSAFRRARAGEAAPVQSVVSRGSGDEGEVALVGAAADEADLGLADFDHIGLLGRAGPARSGVKLGHGSAFRRSCGVRRNDRMEAALRPCDLSVDSNRESGGSGFGFGSFSQWPCQSPRSGAHDPVVAL